MPKRATINVEPVDAGPAQIPWAERQADHDRKLQQYFNTFLARNFSPVTIRWLEQFLTGFFACFLVPDASHPAGARQLYFFELMHPERGERFISQFNEMLRAAGLKLKSRWKYLKVIQHFCDFVLARPDLPGSSGALTVIEKYCAIQQPISKYEMPPHPEDEEDAERYALSRSQRDSLYEYIRTEYIPLSSNPHLAARDFAMVELACMGGFRISELLHMHAAGPDRDVDYVNARARTRWGKASKCKGKRTRWSILPPRTRAVLQQYERHVRPLFPGANSSPELFLSAAGGPLSYQEAWARLSEIVTAACGAGVDLPTKVRWHDLRRTFATLFLEEHPDQFWLLMKLMGHSARATMASYVLIDEETFQHTMRRVLGRGQLSSETASR
jgi:site-specific recombinase XerD